jgi:hypothetical protein
MVMCIEMVRMWKEMAVIYFKIYHKIGLEGLRKTHTSLNEHHGQVGSTPVLYSGCPGSKSQPGDEVS